MIVKQNLTERQQNDYALGISGRTKVSFKTLLFKCEVCGYETPGKLMKDTPPDFLVSQMVCPDCVNGAVSDAQIDFLQKRNSMETQMVIEKRSAI